MLENEFSRLSGYASTLTRKTEYEEDLIAFGNLLGESLDSCFLHPNNFAGYLDHYHHYFGAVIVPFIELVAYKALPRDRIYFVPDCGPIQSELLDLAEHFDFQIKMFPKGCHRIAKQLHKFRHVHMPSYDYCYHTDWWLKPHQAGAIREAAFGFASVEAKEFNCSEESSILFIDRAPPADYYKSKSGITGTSGAQRRSIPNSADLVNRLEKIGQVNRVFLEEIDLRTKIRLFHSADVIVGQMGAGLNGLLWARSGSALVEIHPTDRIRKDYAAYGNIAAQLGVKHFRIIQGDPHSPVDVDFAAAIVERAVSLVFS